MSSDKTTVLYGLLAKLEGTYGGGGTGSASTDGVLLAEPVVMQQSYIYDGTRGNAPGMAGLYRRAQPAGRYCEFEAVIEAAGGGAAYDDSTVWPSIHTMMLAAGHEATVDTTTGSENIEYAPESGDYDSVFVEGYARGQKFVVEGIYADMGFTIDGPGFCKFTFPCQGLMDTDPTDVALPSIDYTIFASQPPKAENIQLSINAVSSGWVVRSIEFAMNRNLSPRADINGTAGHLGYVPGRRAPTLTFVVEARALSSYNPYQLFGNGTSQVVTFTVGSTQYNRFTFDSSYWQISNITEDEDGNAALWTLEGTLASSDAVSNDDYLITFD